MNRMIVNLYRNILNEVIVIENHKKEISKEILLTRDEKKRLGLIYRFLGYDLKKHELLDRAAVAAINNNEEEVIGHLQKLYSQCKEEGLVTEIRKEIKYTEKFLKTIDKAIKYPEFRTFFERRMTKEISKYVIEQARMYNTI